MKTIVAILLLGMTGAALAESSKSADQPITVYKGGKPYIFDSLRRMCPPTRGAPNSCPVPGEVSKPGAEKKPAPKGFG